MPELPEVEVVRRGVQQHVVGRTIAAVEVHHPRAVRRHLPGAQDLTSRLAGRTVTAARRRGKYLWLDLDDPADGPAEGLVAHLGMSGQLLVQPAAAADETHLRARFAFADGDPQLRFVDQRTFGGLALEQMVDDVPASVSHIALDPLDPAYDVEAVVRRIRAKRTGIKRALLDQTVVSGVGNIYADEALWRAQLHGARPTELLTRPAVRRVLAAAAEVMTEALGQGGTSFDALYVNVNGASGYFDRSLNAYGQTGRPCRRCGTLIRRDAFMNRSSFSCPRCQPRPRQPRW
ncbi:MAG TPA: bifunctional DNA-formamidopyrimidine glycosylase/DNA-(apurinic or apyrimidinic site) lyase [Actinomycetales bacterium]